VVKNRFTILHHKSYLFRLTLNKNALNEHKVKQKQQICNHIYPIYSKNMRFSFVEVLETQTQFFEITIRIRKSKISDFCNFANGHFKFKPIIRNLLTIQILTVTFFAVLSQRACGNFRNIFLTTKMPSQKSFTACRK
jgi:hypothetical protein